MNDIEQIIRAAVKYDPEENMPVADQSAIQQAAAMMEFLCPHTTIEPYFDVALDNGVDCYFDSGECELQVHVPPVGSTNNYCFIRINEERTIERDPSTERLIELLHQIERSKSHV